MWQGYNSANLARFGSIGMSSHQSETNPPSPRTSMEKPCKHPQVQIVAREDDVEFVECKDCGEVFEASEFKDMAIEEDLHDEA